MSRAGAFVDRGLRFIATYQPRRTIFGQTLFLTTPPGARIVLRYYVATHSPESFAESRFCLSRGFLFFGAVREHARAQSSWT
jgi:hypothetical protein